MPPAGFASSAELPSGRSLQFAEREEIALRRKLTACLRTGRTQRVRRRPPFCPGLAERSLSLATPAALVTRFCGMVKGKVPDPFEDWLREAEASTLAPFAAGIRRDEGAVRAALSEPWSSGQVEGQVNRLKAIKRTMYGRAGFDLLRTRILAHA